MRHWDAFAGMNGAPIPKQHPSILRLPFIFYAMQSGSVAFQEMGICQVKTDRELRGLFEG